MPNYIRARAPGATWFFTVNLAERGGQTLVAHIAALRAAIRATWRERPFRIDAMVVLPDHLHAVWTLPPGDADFPTRWRLIKSRFSLALPGGEPVGPSRQRSGERGIGQREHPRRGKGGCNLPMRREKFRGRWVGIHPTAPASQRPRPTASGGK